MTSRPLLALILAAVAPAARAADAVPAPPPPPATVSELDTDGDGTLEVVLENAWVRLVVEPARGGRVVEAIYKPAGRALTSPAPLGGWSIDRWWTPNVWLDDEAYTVDELGVGDDGAAHVTLSVRGRAGAVAYLSLRKTLSLRPDRSDLRIDTTLAHDAAAMGTLVVGPWFQHWLGVPGQANVVSTATREGLAAQRWDPAKHQTAERWFAAPSRGWSATIAADGTLGVVWTYPYANTKTAYTWPGPALPTAEVRDEAIALGAGASYATTHHLAPVHGMSFVDGAGDGVAVAIEPRAEQVTARLFPSRAGRLTVTLASRDPRGGAEVVHGSRDVDAAPATPQRLDFTLTHPTGPVEWIVRVRDGEVLVADARRPVLPPGFEGYEVAPLEDKRPGAEQELKKSRPPPRPLSTEVVTPHVPWGRPLAGGRLRVLFVMDDLSARDVVEIAQRLDVDAGYVKLLYQENDARYAWQGDRAVGSGAEARAALTERLAEPWDAIVVGGLDLQRNLGADVVARLADKVRGGTGLVLVGPQRGELLGADSPLGHPTGVTPALPWQARPEVSYLGAAVPVSVLPDTAALRYPKTPGPAFLVAAAADGPVPLAGTARLGQGRVAWAAWNSYTLPLDRPDVGQSSLVPMLPWTERAITVAGERVDVFDGPNAYVDVWYAELARMITWAARGDPAARLVAAGIDDGGLRVGVAGELRGVTLDVAWADRWGRVFADPPPVAASGELTLPVPAERPSGVVLARLELRDATGAALDWGAAAAPASGPRLAVHTDDPWPDDGEPFVFRAEAPGAPDGARARVLVRDARGRLVRSFEAPLGTPQSIAIPERRSAAHAVTVVLTDGARELDRAVVRFSWPNRVTGPWFMTWYPNTSWRNVALTRLQLDAVGVPADVVTEPWTSPFIAEIRLHDRAVSPINLLPFQPNDHHAHVAGWAGTRDERFLHRDPSLSDATWRQRALERLTEAAARHAAQGGGHDHDLGDEMGIVPFTDTFDYDFSGPAREAYRDWLRARYPDIDALNRVWGTKHASFEAAAPVTLDQAQAAGNAAPWSDFRTFMEDELDRLLADADRAARQADPAARVSLSGTFPPSASNGMDWYKLSRTLPYVNGYAHDRTEDMRRDFGDDLVRSPYRAGYWYQGGNLTGLLWTNVLEQAHGLSSWSIAQLLYPDFAPTESLRETQALLGTLRGGPWPLALRAERDRVKIGVHYSQRSLHVATFRDEAAKHAASRNGWAALLDDLALPWRWVAYAEVEAGALETDDLDVLVLPRSYALSDAEVRAMLDFVADGGTLIADVPAGIAGGHGEPRPGALLAAWVGVESAGRARVVRGVEVLGTRLDADVVDASLRASPGTTALATAASGAQAVFVRSLGAGRIVLLNLDPAPYALEQKQRGPRRQVWQDVFSRLLAGWGVTAPIAVDGPDGGDDVRVATLRWGDRRVVTLVRRWEEAAGETPATYTVDVDHGGRIYDVATGEALGRDRLSVSLAPGDGRMFVALDRPPAVSVGRARASPGEVATLRLRVRRGLPDELVRVEVTDATGRERPEYGGVIAAPYDGVWRVPLALDDPRGRWTVAITAVAGGDRAVGALRVD